MIKSKKLLAAAALFFLYIGHCAAKTMSAEQAAEARKKIAALAKQCIGCPYKTGSIGPDAFDCSGLIFTVYRQAAGVQLPRAVKALYAHSKIIKLENAETGDLIFFKTTGDGSITHVGIYIGKNQFIHAASDGNNTGVIVSSLKEKYYKNCFAAVGRVIQSGRVQKENVADAAGDEVISEEDIPELVDPAKYNDNATASDGESKMKSGFLSNITFDAAIFGDWSLFDPFRFMPNWRGITVESNIYFSAWFVKPGLGTIFRYNHGTGNFQLPLVLSLGIGDYLKIYAGPVFNFGKLTLPGGDEEISGSIFPGIFGVSAQTPKLTVGKIGLSLTQDISYTVYKDADGSGLSFYKSVGSGLVFSTGVRVTLPLSNFL